MAKCDQVAGRWSSSSKVVAAGDDALPVRSQVAEGVGDVPHGAVVHVLVEVGRSCAPRRRATLGSGDATPGYCGESRASTDAQAAACGNVTRG
jgi:hypothetical protein